MTFDGFFTRAMVAELKGQLLGGRVSKVYQPFEQELQLVIRSNRTNYRLRASIHPTYYHVCLTDERPANPTHAPMFCMLLRKHLENAIVLDIRQRQNDRIIEFELSGHDELGDTQNYSLFFELMGRHSNILLVNRNKQVIIDCMKHVPISQNSYRTLQPGGQYVAPPTQEHQTNIFALSPSERERFATEFANVLLNGRGGTVVQGMSPLLAQHVAYTIQTQGLSPAQALNTLVQHIEQPQATLIQSERKLFFHALRLSGIDGARQSFDTLSDLVGYFFATKMRDDRVKQLSGDVVQKLNALIDKNTAKLRKLQQDRDTAANADLYRIQGELLNAYSYQVERGQTSVTLDNYYDDNKPLTITLDPRKNAIENSQQLFKKYTKYRDALRYIEEQEQLTQQENDYFQSILVQLQQADLQDIDAIKQELIEQGYSSQRKTSEKKRSAKALPPRQFLSQDGTRILVGRNNHQNDTLSLKTAHKNHWWLHAKNIPGTHVIVESADPSDETMTLAGEIAAYYSKFQHSANVPVDAVQVKHLRKPNGAKPGFVIYEGQRTLFVTPDEARILNHLQTNT